MTLRSNIAKASSAAGLMFVMAACEGETPSAPGDGSELEPQHGTVAAEVAYLEAQEAAQRLEREGGTPEQMTAAWDEVDRQATRVLEHKSRGFEDRGRSQEDPAPLEVALSPTERTRSDEAKYLELLSRTDPDAPDEMRALEEAKKVLVAR